MAAKAERAIRVRLRGSVRDVGLREAVSARASELGVLGWVRHDPEGDSDVLAHLEGDREAVEALVAFAESGPAGAVVEAVDVEEVKPEGHEQFAIRGVSAGAFRVLERDGRFELQLEVGGATRAWAVPKGPSMDPAQKRMAIELAAPGDEPGETWDAGTYEQGGRVAWPEAIERGHAVFVLHGDRLEGGFALQRTRRGERPQWLLIKRRDGFARS